MKSKIDPTVSYDDMFKDSSLRLDEKDVGLETDTYKIRIKGNDYMIAPGNSIIKSDRVSVMIVYLIKYNKVVNRIGVFEFANELETEDINIATLDLILSDEFRQYVHKLEPFAMTEAEEKGMDIEKGEVATKLAPENIEKSSKMILVNDIADMYDGDAFSKLEETSEMAHSDMLRQLNSSVAVAFKPEDVYYTIQAIRKTVKLRNYSEYHPSLSDMHISKMTKLLIDTKKVGAGIRITGLNLGKLIEEGKIELDVFNMMLIEYILKVKFIPVSSRKRGVEGKVNKGEINHLSLFDPYSIDFEDSDLSNIIQDPKRKSKYRAINDYTPTKFVFVSNILSTTERVYHVLRYNNKYIHSYDSLSHNLKILISKAYQVKNWYTISSETSNYFGRLFVNANEELSSKTNENTPEETGYLSETSSVGSLVSDRPVKHSVPESDISESEDETPKKVKKVKRVIRKKVGTLKSSAV